MRVVFVPAAAAAFALAGEAGAVTVDFRNLAVSPTGTTVVETVPSANGAIEISVGGVLVSGTPGALSFTLTDGLNTSAFGIGRQGPDPDAAVLDGNGDREGLAIQARRSGSGVLTDILLEEIVFAGADLNDEVTVFSGTSFVGGLTAGVINAALPSGGTFPLTLQDASFVIAALGADDNYRVAEITFSLLPEDRLSTIPLPAPVLLLATALAGLAAFPRRGA